METKTEVDSTDITEHPHDDKSRPYALTNGTLCGNPSVHNTRCGECLHCGENIVSPQ